MSAPNDKLLRAVELVLAGDWDAAHELVQQYEDDATAAWIHAVLHKMEGDLGNARYWYRQAGRMDRIDDEPRTELAAIQAELRAHHSDLS
jgi:Flp pilus assembly protein TadD